MTKVAVQRWDHDREPTAEELEAQLQSQGLSFYRWSNGPDYVYAAHTHRYGKVILVERGSIIFGLPAVGEEIALEAGDRLVLPGGTLHDAAVGPDGVVCLEAHR